MDHIDKIISTKDKRKILYLMCIGMFLVQLDVTIINIALPTIRSDLQANFVNLQWIVDSYSIFLTSFLLLSGSLGDKYGYKTLINTGLTIFCVASLGCFCSLNIYFLIIFRAIQGLGAAVLLPNTLAMISSIFPAKKEKAKAL